MLGSDGNLWGIVLAAGNGNRISRFIDEKYGIVSPKQYVAFTGKRSMVQHTIHRAETLISPERILVVVNPDHQGEIRAQLDDRPWDNLIFQPQNRETGPGVLLPLVHVMERDPAARVVVLPSDHFVLQEKRFMRYIHSAVDALRTLPEEVILLGVVPDGPEADYGWIQPGRTILECNGSCLRKVDQFLEKPTLRAAARFYQRGYLWNTFVIVARAQSLFATAREYLPAIAARFERIREALRTDRRRAVIEEEYRWMETVNFSRGVFERSPSNVSVIPVRGVLWSDWGSGPRVLSTLKKIRKTPTLLGPEVEREESVA